MIQTSSSISQNDLFHLDDRIFFLRFHMYNSDGDEVLLKKSGIVNFGLFENILSIGTTGYLIIKDDNDSLGRLVTVNKEYDPNAPILDSFLFRGDARDYLQIQVFPEMEGNITEEIRNISKRESYLITFLFAITAVEDVVDTEVEQPGIKYKKLLLEEADIQVLNERNINYSTAQSKYLEIPEDVDASQLSDQDRAVTPNNMLRDIISRSLNIVDDSTNFNTWQGGVRSYFYITDPNAKAIDTVYDILSFTHSGESNNEDPCLLFKGRVDKKWNLVSLSEFFKLAYNREKDQPGPLHHEKFIIAAQTTVNSETPIPPTSKTPRGALTFPEYSLIQSYVFDPFPGDVTQIKINTKARHYYEKTDKTFIHDQKENSIDRLREVLTQNYTQHLKSEGSVTKFNFPSSTLRNTNKNMKDIYSQYHTYPRNSNIIDSLLLNNTISFTAKGLTSRTPGTFISIDRDDDYPETEFDNRLLGIYFVVGVDHIFVGEQYYNKIVAVKPYTFDNYEFYEGGV